jgi:hypothetical protein
VGNNGHFPQFGIQQPLSELFKGEDSELVDPHFVGLSGVSVMSFDDEQVLLEDDSAEDLFFGSPVDAILALPIFEGISLGFTGVVEVGQEGETCDDNNQ